MSNGSGAQLSELRDVAQHNIGQLNRAMTGWFEFARKTLDAAEANVTAFCDHASQVAQAESEFMRSSMASMQKQSMDMVRAGKEAAE